MTTTPTNVNLVVASPQFPKALPVTTDQAINQGDLVWWDAVNGTLKVLATSSNVAVGATGGLCGVANGTNPINIYGTEYVPAMEVTHTGVVSLKTTAGEFYPNFQSVTVGADAQTITLVGQTAANRVGWVITDPPVVPGGAAASTPVGETLAGATGVRARVWLEPKFPATTH